MVDYKDKKVLIVDDMTTMRGLMKTILRDMGFTRIAEAADGVEAKGKLEMVRFNLIICDWDMPRMTGLELLKEVRADDKCKDTPFLMLTANADPNKVKEAIAARVSDYVAKPFQPAALAEKVSKMIS